MHLLREVRTQPVALTEQTETAATGACGLGTRHDGIRDYRNRSEFQDKSSNCFSAFQLRNLVL